MTLKADIKALIHQVTGDMELPYLTQSVFKFPDPQNGWSIRFFDPTAPTGRQLFQIEVDPIDRSEPI